MPTCSRIGGGLVLPDYGGSRLPGETGRKSSRLESEGFSGSVSRPVLGGNKTAGNNSRKQLSTWKVGKKLPTRASNCIPGTKHGLIGLGRAAAGGVAWWAWERDAGAWSVREP